MSLEKKLIYPTLEEIDLIRKKFNSIVDIPYIKEGESNNFDNLNNKNYIQYPKDNSEIIEKLNQKIEELQTALNVNSYKINNYDNLLNKNKELNNLIKKK